MNSSKFFGYGMILISAVGFGSYGVWSKLMGADFPIFFQAGVRAIIICSLMLPFMLGGGSFKRIPRRDWPQFMPFIIFTLFTQAPLYYAYNNADLGTVQLIFYAMFVITAYFVGRFYLGEKISRVKIFAMILAFVGLSFVFGGAILAFAPLGLLLAALNGVASGGEMAFSKKPDAKYSATLIVFVGWVSILITHIPISLLVGESWVAPEFNMAWLWLLVYSVVNAVAFLLSVIGFRLVDASIASLIGLSEIIFAVLFGAMIFHEELSWTVAVGGAIILLAAMLPDLLEIWKRKRRHLPS